MVKTIRHGVHVRWSSDGRRTKTQIDRIKSWIYQLCEEIQPMTARSEVQPCVLAGVADTQNSSSIVVKPSTHGSQPEIEITMGLAQRPCCLRASAAVAITPTRTTCLGSFVVHLSAQQQLINHLLSTNSCGVLLVLLSFERDALKACRDMHD